MKRRHYLRDDNAIEADFNPVSLWCSAEIWGAALITAGAGAYAADQQGDAAEQAAAGGERARQLSQEQFEQSRRDQIPWMQAGQDALRQMRELNSGDYSSFTESPDYQFTRDQGIKGLDRSAASRGTQYSGGQLAALADYSGGLASQNYGQYYNRISQLAGLGQNAAAGVGNQGMQYAGQAGNAIQNAADARAEGQMGQASTYGQMAQQLGGAFGRWYQGRSSGGGPGVSNDQWQSAYAQIPAADPYAWRGG